MDPNFSEELQTMYRNILLQQQNIAYASMIAAFSKSVPSTPTPEIGISQENVASPRFSVSPRSPLSFSLDNEIPRDEIECDAEIILVKNFIEGLKELGTNLNGLHGKKFGFREVIEMANARPAYPASPGSAVKRSRRSMEASFGTPAGRLNSTPMTPSSDEKESSAKKIRKLETPCLEASDTCEMETDSKNSNNSRIRNTPSTLENGRNEHERDEAYKPSKLRIERLRSIQKKKPKFNISSLDLNYHSNMARNFPGSELRTEEQKMRRSKNTLAARISRTKNKAYGKMLESQSITALVDNITMKRKIACLRVYADSLMKLNGFLSTNFSKMWEENIQEFLGGSE